MCELDLQQVYDDEAVRAFGRALNINLRSNDDYASLADMELCESPADFADVIKRFLRRYEVGARKREREGKSVFRPSRADLGGLSQLVDKIGVAPVRAALIAHALVWHETETTDKQKE